MRRGSTDTSLFAVGLAIQFVYRLMLALLHIKRILENVFRLSESAQISASNLGMSDSLGRYG